MNMEEARRLDDNIRKNMPEDLSKSISEAWRYFKTLALDAETPANIRGYIINHFTNMKLTEFENKAPLLLLVDVLTVFDMIKLYEDRSNKIKRRY